MVSLFHSGERNCTFHILQSHLPHVLIQIVYYLCQTSMIIRNWLSLQNLEPIKLLSFRTYRNAVAQQPIVGQCMLTKAGLNNRQLVGENRIGRSSS